MSRFSKENGDATTDTKDSRPSVSVASSGLSDYTAQRLAELRARRAEREQEYKDLKSSTSTIGAASSSKVNGPKAAPASSSTTTASSLSAATPVAAPRPAPSSTESGGNFRTRRTEISTTTNGSSASAASSSAALESKDYSKDYTKDYISKLTTEHRSGCNLSRTSSRSTADQDEDDMIGFASLPEQVHRKALKRGFDFTLMVVGEAGLGKSTLIQSLFLNHELYDERTVPGVTARIAKTVSIEKKYMEIEERGVKLRLTIVDTPGFSDSVNGDGSWQPIERYIEQQFDQYLNDESGLSRKNIKDNRVHCCLYFVSPYGHGLRQMDINFMKRLHDKVNIVPVLAKSDTLTSSEVKKLKQKVLDEVEKHNIRIYEFPECDSDEDDEFLQQDKDLKDAIPFAVIGSNTIVEVNGKKVRGRQYSWGIVEVDNPDHCDFLKLRQMLISTHMQDLKDVTRDVHYENFRAKHIAEQMTKAAQRERNNLELRRPDHQYEEIPTTPITKSKLKRDSSPNFENIMATDQLLKQKDEEIRRMQDMLMKMQAQLQSGSSPGHVNGQLNSGLKKL